MLYGIYSNDNNNNENTDIDEYLFSSHLVPGTVVWDSHGFILNIHSNALRQELYYCYITYEKIEAEID